jgi:hypothetical protein
MADIPVRPRRGVPSWVWFLVGLIVLLVALALIDYFVTNLVLNRAPATDPARPRSGDPFGHLVDAVPLAYAGLLLFFTSAPDCHASRSPIRH